MLYQQLRWSAWAFHGLCFCRTIRLAQEGNPSVKTLLKSAAVTVTGAALVFSGAMLAPASAAIDVKPQSADARLAAAPIDVTRINVAAMSGNSAIAGTSMGVRVGTEANADVRLLGANGYAKVYVDVYRGSTRLQSNLQIAYLSSTGYNWASASFSFRNGWGRGAFRLANVRVTWYDGVSNYTVTDGSYAGGGFSIRSDIRATGNIRSWSNSSRKVAKITLKKYNTNGKWGRYKTKVVLQRKAGGKWKKVKTLKLNRKGKVTYSFRSSKRYKYRFVVKATKTTVGGKFTTRGKS